MCEAYNAQPEKLTTKFLVNVLEKQEQIMDGTDVEKSNETVDGLTILLKNYLCRSLNLTSQMGMEPGLSKELKDEFGKFSNSFNSIRTVLRIN